MSCMSAVLLLGPYSAVLRQGGGCKLSATKVALCQHVFCSNVLHVLSMLVAAVVCHF